MICFLQLLLCSDFRLMESNAGIYYFFVYFEYKYISSPFAKSFELSEIRLLVAVQWPSLNIRAFILTIFCFQVIQFVQARMGVTPGWGGAMQLVDLVGKREALKILSSSKKILPIQALNMGLIDEVISTENPVSCRNILQFKIGSRKIFGAGSKYFVSVRML